MSSAALACQVSSCEPDAMTYTIEMCCELDRISAVAWLLNVPEVVIPFLPYRSMQQQSGPPCHAIMILACEHGLADYQLLSDFVKCNELKADELLQQGM